MLSFAPSFSLHDPSWSNHTWENYKLKDVMSASYFPRYICMSWPNLDQGQIEVPLKEACDRSQSIRTWLMPEMAHVQEPNSSLGQFPVELASSAQAPTRSRYVKNSALFGDKQIVINILVLVFLMCKISHQMPRATDRAKNWTTLEDLIYVSPTPWPYKHTICIETREDSNTHPGIYTSQAMCTGKGRETKHKAQLLLRVFLCKTWVEALC